MKLTFDKPLYILLIVTVIFLTGTVAWACTDHQSTRLLEDMPFSIRSNHNVGDGTQKCVTHEWGSSNKYNLQTCRPIINPNQLFSATAEYLDSSRNSIYYNIHPFNNDAKCFDIDRERSDGYMIKYNCTGGDNQRFILTSGTAGVSIHPYHSTTQCLDDWSDGYLYSNDNCLNLPPQSKPTFVISYLPT